MIVFILALAVNTIFATEATASDPIAEKLKQLQTDTYALQEKFKQMQPAHASMETKLDTVITLLQKLIELLTPPEDPEPAHSNAPKYIAFQQ